MRGFVLSLRSPGWSSRFLLAWAIALSPLSAVQAQQRRQAPARQLPEVEPPGAGLRQPRPAPRILLAPPDVGMVDTTWLTPQSVAAAYLRPKQILTGPNSEMLPLEVFAALGLKYLGIEPIDIERVTVVVEPMLGVQPYYAVVLRFARPFRLEWLSAELTGHTEAGELQGKAYRKSREAAAPSLYLQDERTLIAAPEPMLKKLLAQGDKPKESILIAEVKDRPASDDFYLAVDTKTLRPLIAMALGAQSAEVPPQFHKYLQAPRHIRAVELALNISNNLPPLLNIHGDDEAAAQALERLIDEGLTEGRAQLAAMMAEDLGEEPIEQAMAAYSQRMIDHWLGYLRPVRDGETLAFFPADPKSPNKAYAQMQIAVIGVLVALLLPAVQAAREAARRAQSTSNMKQLMLGLLNYESVHKHYPAHASYSEDGKPLLSWRVHILPYLEEQALYDQFHLDEPWDSEHNKQLIEKMPAVFQSASSPLKQSEGKTIFLAPVGENFVFDGTQQGGRIARITDGTSKTIMLVEADADKAVIWTKPEDLQVDPENPLAGLGGLRSGNFMAAFADGHVRAISARIDPNVLMKLFLRNDGQVIDANELDP